MGHFPFVAEFLGGLAGAGLPDFFAVTAGTPGGDPTQANKEQGVTEDSADQFTGALKAAINGVEACKSDAKATRKLRETAQAAKKALRKRLRGVINEGSDSIPEDDARWAALGFNLPGDAERPEAVA